MALCMVSTGLFRGPVTGAGAARAGGPFLRPAGG